MKIFVISSNKYAPITPINVHFLNKHWPGQDISMLGYEAIEALEFPSNVKKEILGKQSDFGTSWSNALIPFFENVPNTHFIILMDDLILMNDVDPDRMSNLENQVAKGYADKALVGGGIPFSAATKINEKTILFNQGLNYRATLSPSIWRKEYFLRYLKPNMSTYDFEVRNNTEAARDNARIITDNYIYPETRHPFSFLNLYSKGELLIDADGNVLTNQPSSRFFDKNIIKHIWNIINE
jgi:hypothetical protein